MQTYSLKIKDQAFDFKTQDGVFYPTNTSESLISGSQKHITAPGKLLDLGCGIGVIGITLARLGLARRPVFASDLSQDAIDVAYENAASHQCELVARVGALFEPWGGEIFEYIVADVPGISEDVAVHSRWFPKGVPCASGRDGTRLVGKVIEEAPRHLEPHGLLIFPVLSLSNTDEIISLATRRFRRVERVLRRMWPVPEELKVRMDLLNELHREGNVHIEEKFGLLLWYTDVYVARN